MGRATYGGLAIQVIVRFRYHSIFHSSSSVEELSLADTVMKFVTTAPMKTAENALVQSFIITLIKKTVVFVALSKYFRDDFSPKLNQAFQGMVVLDLHIFLSYLFFTIPLREHNDA